MDGTSGTRLVSRGATVFVGAGRTVPLLEVEGFRFVRMRFLRRSVLGEDSVRSLVKRRVELKEVRSYTVIEGRRVSDDDGKRDSRQAFSGN